MIVSYKLKFSTALPQPETILSELRMATGLGDVDYHSRAKRRYIVFHHSFQLPEFSLYFDASLNEVVCWTKHPKINYLLEATISVLEKLGGKYQFEINELARDKWENVKDVYKERFIVDVPDNLNDVWAST